ncbi:GNAT family N-acetyltransferase [Bacillus thuringiensis]|uniref:GNAT family N-acetyltransferase n=1 Tax=Bacillus thuringiensis TaxID=1428 RepID=UPI0011A9FD79|nr:GNAT family N-acetyltransferase [Bacillus thuringiensis]
MNEYQLISDYKQNEKYKESFNDLAKHVFELDFKGWYDRGCWNDNYICYSYVDGDKVIAKTSINKMNVISNGKEYKVIQLGTVMTHPDYRHQGLATKLMNHIIKKYEKDYDFIYLFANDTVLEFYPKFGFEKVQESSFSLKVSNMIRQIDKKYDLRKLDVNNQADFELMKEYEAERIPVSSRLGLKNSNIIHFNMLIIFCCLVS